MANKLKPTHRATRIIFTDCAARQPVKDVFFAIVGSFIVVWSEPEYSWPDWYNVTVIEELRGVAELPRETGRPGGENPGGPAAGSTGTTPHPHDARGGAAFSD